MAGIRATIVALAGTAAVFVASGAPAADAADGGPLVMRRLTEDQYRASVQAIFGDVTLGGKFEPDARLESLIAVGAGQATVTAAGIEEYDRMAMGIAGQVVDPQRRDQLIPCKPAAATAADDACAREFLGKAGHLLFRRPLTPAELTGYVKVAAEGAAQVRDFYFGLQLALGGLLEAPQFLFVQERSEPDPARPDSLRLTPQSMATRLSLFLWGATPDLKLLAAAENGELASPEGLARQVDRMLASPRLETGVRTFFADMLGFDIFQSLEKDGQLFPNFSADVAKQSQEQTLRTIVDHLLVRDGDYRDLFTTNRTFLTPLLASVYGVPFKGQWGRPWEWTEFEMPADMPQAGVLTHISFLAPHAHPGSTSPTLRGKALRELLMCQKVPDPPANVDFSKFESSAKEPTTLRERLSAHNANPVCAGCHKITDPIGLAMEHYDAIGRFRRTEHDTVIDASGTLDGVDYQDVAGVGRILRDNPQTTGCLVRRAFAYGIGRPATEGEAEWVNQQLASEFASDGYRMRRLLRRIALSPGFFRVSKTEDAVVAAR